jgi:uncharacterized membrane protein
MHHGVMKIKVQEIGLPKYALYWTQRLILLASHQKSEFVRIHAARQVKRIHIKEGLVLHK